MAKQLNVKLTFNADTDEAKKKIQELQTSLRDVAKLPGGAAELFDDASIQKASNAALELEQHLSKAVNVDTGKLDLSRFSQSLKASGKDLNQYCDTLLSIGPTGQQAFLKLAQAIATADTPVTRINGKIKELGNTLANTARWQISSSILHGFMGAIQSAYGYAEDLNKSLNDIRIVTGKSTEEMAQFAKKANDVAKALSTTTNEYAEASLIYFQQGDDMIAVEEKAAITVKMAQVTGQSMETVSNQMTSVWNNFYNGSQTLEHYADAMARLGAITASSSDEIALGLEKFASVADMIGLGFDQAAAALTTVTANTRQSADVVGTAFKTLFARIQGLNLGETLDDGTTLNKYSEALNKVGINIKDTSGQMKGMNTIINEMGERWNTLSKDQQTALAQTVAGVRQYGQLVALMENFDEYQANLTEAQGADGALGEQAAIYAESWEAARDRVQAALEGVYDSLINDEFFIDLLNGLEKLIKGIETVIDTFGGLGGIAQSIGGILLTVYANKIPEVVSGLTQNIRTLTGQAKKDMEAMQIQMDAKLDVVKADPTVSESFKIQAEGIEKVNFMKQKLVKASETLTAAEREEYEARIRNVQAMYKDIDVLTQKKDAAEEKIKTSQKNVVKSSVSNVQQKFANFNTLNEKESKHTIKIMSLNEGPTTAANMAALEYEEASLEKVRTKITQVDEEITKMAKAYGLTTEQVQALVEADGEITPDVYVEIQKQVDAITNSFSNLMTRHAALQDMTQALRGQINAWDEQSQKVNEAAEQLEKLGKKGEAQRLLISYADEMKAKMEAYLTTIAKVSRDKGLDSVAKEADAAREKIEKMTASMMVKNGKVDLGSMISTDEFNDMMHMADKSLRNLDHQIERTRDQMEAMQFDPEAMKELEKSAQEAADASVNLNNAIDNTNQQAKKSPESTFKMSEALTSIGGAAMATMGAVESLKNGFSTIFNADTSIGEKMAASIAMITAAMGAYNAVTSVSNVLLKSRAVAEMTATLMTKLGIAAKVSETGAVVANTAAWYANPIMWIALIVVGAIAAFAGLVAIITAVSKALKAMDPEEKLKTAEQEATRMAEELDKARQAADNLRNSIDKYDSAIDKMKSLTAGTEEYRAALDEANAEAQKLIEENSELNGKYSFNVETGLIEFDEGVLEDLQLQKDEAANMARNNTIVANSNVAKAKNNVLIDENTKNSAGETAGAFVGTAAAAAGAALIPIIGPLLSLGTLVGSNIINKAQKEGQEDALNHLAEAFNDSNGNFVAAMDSLSQEEQELIDQLNLNDNSLLKLTQELAANQQAIKENSKQLLHNQFSNSEAFQKSSNKEFLLTSMDDDLKKATAEKEKEYDKKKDKVVEAEYAQKMGWGTDFKTKTKDGVVTYTDKDGNELGSVNEDSLRQYLAQEAALDSLNNKLEGQASKVEELGKQEKILAKQFEDGDITYEEYAKAVAAAGEYIGFTAEEMKNYTQNYGSDVILRERKEQNLATTMSNRFNLGGNESKQFVESITQDMNDEQLEIALDIAATAQSLDDFKRQFQHSATEALIASIDSSQENVSAMLSRAKENKKFDTADISSLQQDDNFTAWLEQNNRTIRELTNASYSEQYNIISQFYSNLQQMESENLELQKQNYQSDLAEYQAIMDYKMAEEQGNSEAMQEIQEQWGSSIDFEAYLNLNTEDIQTELDLISNKIKEVTDEQYAIDMSWDNIDQLEGSMEDLANLTSMMEEEAMQVGDSYMLTAAQGREWIEMYPELFENAETTTDGLIQLSKDDYEVFKQVQDAERKAALDTEIQMLESRLAELDAEEQAAQQELDLIAALEEGKVDYAQASTDSIVSTRQNLTQFYIDSGYDEVSANQMALEQMGLTQEQYNQLIADSTEANAEDMAAGAQSGAEATRKTYSSLAAKLKDIFGNIGKAIKAVFTGDWDSISGYFSDAWEAAKGEIKKESTVNAASDKVQSNIGGEIKKYDSSATLAETKTDAFDSIKGNIQNNLDNISNQRESISNQITYLNTLKNQDIEDYGITDPEKASGNRAIGEDDIEKAEKKEPTKDRYTNIDNQLNNVSKAMAIANREMDNLYGGNRAEKMKQINKLLADEVTLLSKKAEEAKEYQKIDAQSMQDAFKTAGVELTVNEDGSVNTDNIESVLDTLDSQYNQLVDNYNNVVDSAMADGVISTEEQENLDSLSAQMEEKEQAINEAKAAYDKYMDTLNLVEETETQIAEKQNEIKSNNYQTMADNLNLALKVTTEKTQEIDYYLSKMSDDFYKAAEAAALMGGKVSVSTEVLALQKQHADGLAEAYAAGNITQADYIAGLTESRDAIYSELEALSSLDKDMQEYYGNTLSSAGEELNKYTDKMNKLSSTLDHYQSLLTIIGKETDYKSMGVVLQGMSDTAKNSMEVAKAEYEFYQGEAEKKKALMESVPEGSAAFEQYKKEWEAAEEAAQESQDEMLTKTAEWAESMKSILTNKLSDFAQTLEKQLTGGTSFDEMTTAIERSASLQENYLTTTNQIYETTKMMRVAEKALDETTNTAAKNKLKGFIETTKQLQNQEKLSKYELEMQQSKYDLLVAEIALEEAKNAKSTVRLQRDSEGNFGYVYTADANTVADAEQKVDDAQNALYNKGLEGANDFAQKQAQLAQEGSDALTTLSNALANGEITMEEWEKRTAETKEFYSQKIQEYSSLYQTAISADGNIMQESWSSNFSSMITDADSWAASVDQYLANSRGSFETWQTAVSEIQTVVGSNQEEISTKVNEVTNANDALAEGILKEGGVLDTVSKEVDAVSGATTAYANKRAAILELISANETYIESLNGIIAAEGGTAIVGNTTTPVSSVTAEGFDTGGYTGDWGPSGKLAVLHQKEIVLNASDTENLLAAVTMVRTILQAIDMQAASAQIGGILSTPGLANGNKDSLEQHVQIEASFPNVQDRNEIEEAFNNLINKASQYANR